MTEATSAPHLASDEEHRHGAPVMRSVVHRRHAAMGATFERRGNWSVPDFYGSFDTEIAALHTSLGFADISARGKVHLSGAVDEHVRALTGVGLKPFETARVKSGGLVAMVTRDWALALLSASAESEVIATVEHLTAGTAMATDVTCAWSGFLVAGPRLEELLARTMAMDPSDLRPGGCVAASWARIPAILVAKDLPEPAAEIFVSSDHGRYAWGVLERLVDNPVGWRALEAWGWT